MRLMGHRSNFRMTDLEMSVDAVEANESLLRFHSADLVAPKKDRKRVKLSILARFRFNAFFAAFDPKPATGLNGQYFPC